MGRYDGQRIVRNIERILNGETASVSQEASRPAIEDVRPQHVELPEAIEELRHEILPDMYMHAGVDTAPEATRLAAFKKVLLLLLRPLAKRQAAFNHHTGMAVEILAGQIEELHRRIAHNTGAIDSIEARVKNLIDQNDALAESLFTPEERIEEIADRIAAVDHRVTAIEQHELEALRERIAKDREKDLEPIRRHQDTEVSPAVQGLHTKAGELEGRLRDAEARLRYAAEMQSHLLERLREGVPAGTGLCSELPEPPRSPRAATEDRFFDDLAYVQFQQRFRGDRALLLERQGGYIDIVRSNLRTTITSAPRMLDLACGDGVLVELARDAGWQVRGVDLNAAMVRLATERGLPVEQGDALEYLASQPTSSVDIIATVQFIEHLESSQLTLLLRESHRVLTPGGILLIETLNPNTLLSAKWFHFDLSHKHLVFPQLLEMLAEVAGLSPIEWKGVNLVPEYERLVETASGTENEKRLNQLLFGPQDYYLISRKPV